MAGAKKKKGGSWGEMPLSLGKINLAWEDGRRPLVMKMRVGRGY